MRTIFLIIITFFLLSCSERSVKIIPINENDFKTSKRGLYAVNNNVIWSSGTGGIVMKTTDNNNWTFHYDSSIAHLDFRDIHAFNEQEAIIMSSGDGCEIYKTSNGAKTWSLVYQNHDKGIFFDGMDFWDNQHGLAFGDPIDNHIYIIETKNGGSSWNKLSTITLPKTLEGEAGFAASGTGIQCVGDSTVYIGTGGGEYSRIFISNNRGLTWKVVNTPMRTGEASGIYSLVFTDDKNGVLVGGNYLDSLSLEGNCAITSDGGNTWSLPKTPPTGYISCVAFNGDDVFLSTGRSGVDVSYDKGINWKHLSNDAYYSCVLNKEGGWLTGRNGKMAKIIIK